MIFDANNLALTSATPYSLLFSNRIKPQNPIFSCISILKPVAFWPFSLRREEGV